MIDLKQSRICIPMIFNALHDGVLNFSVGRPHLLGLGQLLPPFGCHFLKNPSNWYQEDSKCKNNWSEALSSLLAQGGPFGHFQGVLLWGFFFTFGRIFDASKRPPEKKTRQAIRFQTMRNPMVSMIFPGDHGNSEDKTTFGLIFGRFSWKFLKIPPESSQIQK